MRIKVENLADGRFPDTKMVLYQGKNVTLALGKFKTETTEKIFNSLQNGDEIEVNEYKNDKGYITLYLVDPEKKKANPSVKMAGLQEQISQLDNKIDNLTQVVETIKTKIAFIVERIDKSLSLDEININPNQSKAGQSMTNPITEDNNEVPF